MHRTKQTHTKRERGINDFYRDILKMKEDKTRPLFKHNVFILLYESDTNAIDKYAIAFKCLRVTVIVKCTLFFTVSFQTLLPIPGLN